MSMSVGESFVMAGHIYVLAFAIALGMAALIKLINFIIRKTEQNASSKSRTGGEGDIIK